MAPEKAFTAKSAWSVTTEYETTVEQTSDASRKRNYILKYFSWLEMYLVVSGMSCYQSLNKSKVYLSKAYCIVLCVLSCANALRFVFNINTKNILSVHVVTGIVCGVFFTKFAFSSLNVLYRASFLLKFRELYLDASEDNPSDFYGTHLGKVLKRLFGVFSAFTVFCFILCICIVVLPETGEVRNYCAIPFNTSSTGYVPLLYLSAIIFIFVYQSWSAGTTIFIFLCFVIVKEYTFLSQSVQNSLGKDGRFFDDLERIRRKHNTVGKMVGVTDDMFCYIIGANFLTVMVLSCLLLYTFARGNLDQYIAVGLIVFGAYTLGECGIVFVGCVAVRNAAQCITNHLYDINLDHLEKDDTNKVIVFLSRLSTGHTGLTAARLFTVDKGAILTIVGTIVTYAVVVIQFHQASPAIVFSEQNVTQPNTGI